MHKNYYVLIFSQMSVHYMEFYIYFYKYLYIFAQGLKIMFVLVRSTQDC